MINTKMFRNDVGIYSKTKTIFGTAIIAFFLIANPGCKKDEATTTNSYQTVKLVADIAAYEAATVDANLVNPWGMVINPSGGFWVSNNLKSVSTVYDRTGATLATPIKIGSNGLFGLGSPTGVVYNKTTDFVSIATTNVSKLIFATANGTINTWSGGDSTFIAVNRSLVANANYKGLAIATSNSMNYIYAANFTGKKIDVYDANFNYVNMNFSDPTIPLNYAPFNIQNIGGYLYVTYAAISTMDNTHDQAAVGNGYVNVFGTNGVFIKRFASQGTLNSPWGIAQAPSGFGVGSNAILVGNFGDGKINVYDSTGTYKGQLKDGSNIVYIAGLRALAFPQNGIPSGDQNQLFFTAGPNDETHGLFGYLKLR